MSNPVHIGDCTLYLGDCRDILPTLPDASVQCCVTSPPYWGLRDYGVSGQLGLEPTPEEYVANVVAVFREVRRVLRDDGTVWLNLGDSYAANRSYQVTDSKHIDVGNTKASSVPPGLKPKDLIMIPARVALALQADGWYLRSDIIWNKPNPMPESVTDRPTKAHEYIFLLSKRERYYYDAEAVREVDSGQDHWRGVLDGQPSLAPPGQPKHQGIRTANGRNGQGRNRRSVWTVPTHPFSEAHFATFPPDLIRPCILACCPEGGTVLDPFGGAGTVGLVCAEEGRKSVLIELNGEYGDMAMRRIAPATRQGRLFTDKPKAAEQGQLL